jgi:hypothetical protein
MSLLPVQVVPLAEAPPQLSVAVMTATSQKEDSAVKTPQNPLPRQSASASSTQRASKASRLGPACAAGLLVAGCPNIPARPAPKECPAAAIDNMKALGIEPGAYVELKIDANGPPPAKFPNHTFREGPIVSLILDTTGVPDEFEGALLHGKVIPGSGEYFFIRYEAAQLLGSIERIPVCAVALDPQGVGAGVPKKEGSTDTAWNSLNGTSADFVFSFSE